MLAGGDLAHEGVGDVEKADMHKKTLGTVCLVNRRNILFAELITYLFLAGTSSGSWSDSKSVASSPNSSLS